VNYCVQVKCGEVTCTALFHVPCALTDPRCTAQVVKPQIGVDSDDPVENDVQLL
jgi:hypothetical protein